jgi:hypothetical protein
LHDASEAGEGKHDAARIGADGGTKGGEDFGERTELVEDESGKAVLDANEVGL